ncbi:MAG: hypothetical protein H6985_17340 [Pseudomonadales bacterium]|nr:hypothetical protein [Halioglobus sp.]MCP5131331.1 hypothetical protein [Pseudomonadales bacterium]
MTTEAKVDFELVLGEGGLAEAMEKIERMGGEIRSPATPYEPDPDELDDLGDSQFDPLMVIAASLALGYLIKTISEVWLDETKGGGQLVDARSSPVKLKRLSYVDRGKLVIVTDKGVETYGPEQRDEGEEVLAQLLSRAQPA